MLESTLKTKAGRRSPRIGHVAPLLLLPLTGRKPSFNESLPSLDTVLWMNAHLLHGDVKILAKVTPTSACRTGGPAGGCVLPPLILEIRTHSSL